MNAYFELFGKWINISYKAVVEDDRKKRKSLSEDEKVAYVEEIVSAARSGLDYPIDYFRDGDRLYIGPSIDYIVEHNDIKWADVSYGYYSPEIFSTVASNHTKDDVRRFLEFLRGINYDDGFGTQHLFGTVVFNDGSWNERWEYDGSEGWSHKSIPQEPIGFTSREGKVEYEDDDTECYNDGV